MDTLNRWYSANVGREFMADRQRIATLLHEENDLMEIVKLIGSDVLPDDQKLVIETAKVIRVGFLQQNAYHADDTYVPLEKQLGMMKVILYLYDQCAMIPEGPCHFDHSGHRHLRRSGQNQVRCAQQQAGTAGRLLHPDRPGPGFGYITREEREQYESENCGT